MNSFWQYLKLVVTRLASRVFLIFDALGVLFYFYAKDIPHIPAYASALVFALIIFLSCYQVWKDEALKCEKLIASLESISSTIPKFSITYSGLEKYSVVGLIGRCREQINELERKVSPRIEDERPMDGSLSSISRALQQLTAATSVVSGLMNTQTNEERVDRLKEYLEELEHFEAILHNTYKVDLSIESTRHDTDVEIEIRSAKPAIFIQDDDFINTFQPEMASSSAGPLHIRNMDYGRHHLPLEMMPDINSSNLDSIEGSRDFINTHIKWINADHKESIFTEKLFIQSNDSSIDLVIAINSSKLHKAQIMTMCIPTEGIDVEGLQGHRSD